MEIGPGLAETSREHISRRAKDLDGDLGSALLFVMPARTSRQPQLRSERTGSEEPVDRTTVSHGWHKHALGDSGLRDMPLHSLRHTTAAAWLAAGNSLTYVQRQLGHADIATTAHHYGHLERRALAAGAAATEEAIERAVQEQAQR